MVPNPFRYGGYYYDSSTGLYYLWHRYYDPGTTRFLTVDPARLLTGDRYSYCGENPLGQVDPSGLIDWSAAYDFMWGEDNPLFQDAYENGASWVPDFNPIYVAINGYYNEVQAALKGCSWSDCFSYGMEGVAGVVGTVTLFMPWGGTTLSLGGEAGFINLGRDAAASSLGLSVESARTQRILESLEMSVREFIGKNLQGRVFRQRSQGSALT